MAAIESKPDTAACPIRHWLTNIAQGYKGTKAIRRMPDQITNGPTTTTHAPRPNSEPCIQLDADQSPAYPAGVNERFFVSSRGRAGS